MLAFQNTVPFRTPSICPAENFLASLSNIALDQSAVRVDHQAARREGQEFSVAGFSRTQGESQALGTGIEVQCPREEGSLHSLAAGTDDALSRIQGWLH